MKNDNYHESVMVREAIEALHIKKARKYIDATVGTAGHTFEMVKNAAEVLGIEADEKMLEIAKERLEDARPTPKLIHGNFVDILKIAKENDFNKVSGILFDLGVSNLHLTQDNRGFSFSNLDDTLDMRLDRDSQGVKASDLLNVLREDQLVDLFSVVMDSGSSKWISKKIIEERNIKPFEKVSDLLVICKQLRGKPGISSATLPFLALRIAVNSELDNLKNVLPEAYDLLESSGYLVIITFHSGEDRIVKNYFKNYGGGELIFPSIEEINSNPRARSAKLRVLQKK